VSTITAILEPHADGSLYLPVLAEMRRGKVKVIATLIPISGSMEQEAGQRVKTLDLLMAHYGARRHQEYSRSGTVLPIDGMKISECARAC
jgi:hypothetical protein